MASENREPLRKKESRVACPDNVPKIKARRVNKGMRSSGREKATGENRTKGRHISDSLDGSSHAHSNNLRTIWNRRVSSGHARGIFDRGYGRRGARSVQRGASIDYGGGRSNTIPAICVI